jgi:DNA primase
MAGLVPQQTLEQIRAASDIVDVIGAYVPLKRAGANFVAVCPFHKEKTPSFNVNPQRQIFHCFGCHKGGDVFTFVKDYENIPFMEAVRRLAERARIPLEFEQNPGQEKVRFLKETLYTLHEQITQRWQTVLTNDAAGEKAREYLAERGVSAEAVALFRLGCAPDAWDDTVNWAKSKGHDLATVEQAGLIIRKDPEGGGPARYYDRFRGRLMFPICDEQGRVIGFSGRVLARDEKTAKYVNSPETPLFHKGRVIYGLDKSKRALLDTGTAVICEGQLDLIACFLGGVQNVAAPQGTALTGDHCRILKRYVNEVVLCFDSDAAGQNAALRALDDLLASGLAIRVATVPAPHDPDSFIRAHGGDAFRQLLERAPGFFDHFLEKLCRENDLRSDRGRAAVVQGIGGAVMKTGDAVLVDTFARKAAQFLGVGMEAVRAEFRKNARGLPAPAERAGPGGEPGAAPESAPPLAPPSANEFWLLRVILVDEDLVEWALGHLDLQWVEHPVVRHVLEVRFAAFQRGEQPGVPQLLAELEDPRATALVTEAAATTSPIEERARIMMDAVRRVRDRAYERELADLTRVIANPTTAPAERVAALQRQMELRRARTQPLRPRSRPAD